MRTDPPDNLIKKAVFLTPEQIKKLNEISAETGASISTLIRMSVEFYLEKKR